MKNMTLEHIAAVCGGTYIGNEADKKREIKGAVIDSRLVEKDYLFIPVRGEKVDGHSFIPSVFEKGALAVFSEEKLENPAGPYILVENTLDAMKKIAAPIRTELAQYRELAVFAQFGSDLDPATRASLNRGEQLTEALKQSQYSPYSYAEEAIIINILSEDLCPQVPPEQINRFMRMVLDNLRLSHPEVIFNIEHDDVITEDSRQTIISVIQELLGSSEE